MKRQNKIFIVFMLSIGLCLFLFGCHPKRITWSSDGKYAAYCNDVGLFFIDGQGNISKKILDHVYRAEWFPDGKRLAIEQFENLKTWQQIENTVTADQKEKYIKYADTLRSVKNQQAWDEKVKRLSEQNLLDDDEFNAVKLYIRDKAATDFPKEIIQSLKGNIKYPYHFLRIGTWDGKTFTVGKPLWKSPERIWDMRVSPKGKVVAFTTAFPEDFVSSLWCVDVDSNRLELLDRNTALYPDWDPEGLSLVYVRSIGKESTDNPLGTLLGRKVCNQDGVLLTEFPKPQSLAGLVANDFTKVRCLSDGRIIFSSIEVTLPAIGEDVPGQNQLFVLDPKRQSTIVRMIPRSSLNSRPGYNYDFFEVSPDQTRISIPCDGGRVIVLNIATGDLVGLQAEDAGEIKTVPVWRYPDELCYIGVNGKGAEMMLRKVQPDGTWAQPRAISEKWPKEARKNILD